MTLTQVLYALAVEERLNFSAAAKALFVSQPALSLQIK
ncbi:MAG: LysR family transcriptional regulator, partial [Pyramidobacter sp.]|nr:LysR family transcriptional regulator [Pyramidobacter sp.]